uniref:Cyclic nucleotide-binding domain-containing protein n=1 Tax=Lygus hesperus TaxID=30085 RepID=A0A0A9XK11_LYGHE
MHKAGRRAAISAIPLSVVGVSPLSDLQSGISTSTSSTETAQGSVSQEVSRKTPNEEKHLRQLMKKCHLFSDFEPIEKDVIMRMLHNEKFTAGTTVLKQGM